MPVSRQPICKSPLSMPALPITGWYSTNTPSLKPDIELTPVSDKQRQEMKLLEKRFRDMIYTKGKVTEKEAETIRKKYDLYQITYKDGQVSGVPVFMVRASEAYERMIPDWDKDMLTKMGIEMRAYFDLMKRIAVAYNNSEAGSPVREEMRRKFLCDVRPYHRSGSGLW